MGVPYSYIRWFKTPLIFLLGARHLIVAEIIIHMAT